MFMAKAFVAKDAPNKLTRNNFVLPKVWPSFHGINTIRQIDKKYVRLCQEKSKSSRQCRIPKEILSQSRLLITAVLHVKVLL